MELIDFLSHKPRFFVNCKDKFYSKIGFTISLASLLAIVSLAVYFIIATFSRSTVFIRYSTSTKYEKWVNLTDSPLLFSLLDYRASPYTNPEMIYNFYLSYNYFIPGNATQGIDNRWGADTVLLNQCKREDFKGSLFETFPNIEKYFCIMPGTKNLTIYNRLGDLANGFAFINIMINKCSNTSQFYTKGGCSDSQTINNALSRGFLTFTYIDNYIDHNDVTKPNVQYIANQILDLSTLNFQRIYFNIKNIIYETEDGFVFESRNTVKFTQQDSIRLYSDSRPSGYYPETFSTLYIHATDITDVYNRSYVKLQNLLANIGGVVNGIMTMATILMNILTKRLNLMTLIDCVYKLEDARDVSCSSSNIVSKSNVSGTSLNMIRFNHSPISQLKKGTDHVVHNKISRDEGLKLNDLKASNLRLNCFEYICPISLWNPKLYLIDKYEKVIQNELSIDNLINKSGEVNKLVEMLSYDQKVSFKRLNTFNLAMIKIGST
jgi:hypothetical protein